MFNMNSLFVLFSISCFIKLELRIMYAVSFNVSFEAMGIKRFEFILL